MMKYFVKKTSWSPQKSKKKGLEGLEVLKKETKQIPAADTSKIIGRIWSVPILFQESKQPLNVFSKSNY